MPDIRTLYWKTVTYIPVLIRLNIAIMDNIIEQSITLPMKYFIFLITELIIPAIVLTEAQGEIIFLLIT